MSNITLSVDDEVIKKVRKIAIDKNTTLTQTVREFLISAAEREGCKEILSEDLNAGQSYNGVIVRNPFSGS